MQRKTLINVFPEWNIGGIFTALNEFAVPWKEDDIAILLDYEYYGNISGGKYISPLIEKMLNMYTQNHEYLSSEDINILAEIIFKVYQVNWNKLYETLSLEYDPIENYSMVEEMQDDEKVTEYGKTVLRTDNLQRTKTGTETETPDLATDDNNSVYGFNSSSSVPSTTNHQTATGDTTTEYDLTEGGTGTQTHADSGSDTETRNYTLTRSGNIGVTTAQQMIESERNLWLWNFFHGVVFPDVDKILTINIY